MNDLTLSTEQQRDLPTRVVDRLFDRLAAMYGKEWFAKWANVPMADVKDAWQTGLGRFSLEQLKTGLERCQTECKFPPSMPEFAALCVSSVQPQAHRLALDSPRQGMPPEVKAKLDAFVASHKA